MNLKTISIFIFIQPIIFFSSCGNDKSSGHEKRVNSKIKNESSSFNSRGYNHKIQSVKIHPIFKEYFVSSEHYDGEYKYLGDQLGRDFRISKKGSSFISDGSRNEHYHVWEKNVLAPFDGVVQKVRINDKVNEPGKLGDSPASVIVFKRADSVKVIYAHVRNILVQKGQTVKAGEIVAQVGNNGMSTGPHIHVGAWLGDRPLQIQVDLKAMGELRRERKK